MPLYYFLLSVGSMLAFGFIGWRLAVKRGRNPIGWMVAGAVFPPLVLIVFFMTPTAADAAATAPDDESADVGR